MFAALALAEEPAGGEETNNFLIPNGTFFVEVLIFLGILWFLYKKVVPRITAMLEERQQTIRQEIESAEQARRELQESKAQYAQALAEAREEASKMREDAARTRREIIEEAREEARAEAEAIAKRAQEQLAVEHRQAIARLRREVGQMSAELASRIVGESLADQALQSRIVDRFVAELEGAETSAAGQPQQVS